MKIDLDASFADTCIELWRNSVDLKMPMADEFKTHFMEQRGTILRNFEQTASAWLMLLGRAVPAAADKADFDAFVETIKAFRAWAKDEIAVLERMALQAGIEANIEEIMQDSQLGPAMRDLASKIIGKRKPD